MGAGAIHGHQDPDLQSTSSSHNPSLGNPSTSPDCSRTSYTPSSARLSPHHSKNTMKMSCEMCSTSFTFFKRKKFCQECHRYFCSTCLPKPPSSSPVGRQCRKCLLLISGNFTRDDLQDWKVKDIRCFLDVHKVSTKGCREKHDLVELALSQFCKERRNSLEHQAEHDMLVQQMAARLTLDNARSQAANPNTEETNEAIGVSSNTNRDEHPVSSSTRSRTGDSGRNPDQGVGEDSFAAMNSQEFRDFLQSQVEEILNSEFAQRETEMTNQSTAPSHSGPTRCHLEEVQTLEDIDSLSVRQLKELLVNNFVNFKGCCEKPELIQRVKRLWNDHQENKIKAERIHKADEDAACTTTHPDQNLREDNSSDVPAASSSPNAATTTTMDHIPVPAPTSTTSEDHLLSPPDVSTLSIADSPSSSPSKNLPITSEDPQDSLCRVCMDALTNCILLECGHMVTCTTCGKQLAECPICRQYISRVVRVFRS